MDSMKALLDSITVNTQSSIRFEYAGKVYYVDPIELTRPVNDADYIFVTHDHGDHYDESSIANIIKPGTLLVTPESTAKKAAVLAPENPRLAVQPEQWYQECGAEFETVPAYNIDKKFHPKDNGWVGYLFYLGDLRLYVAGDTDATDDAEQVSADIVMVPIGGYYTMNYAEAAELVNEIAPEVVIPTHYGTIVGDKEDGEKFAKLIDEGTTVLFRL